MTIQSAGPDASVAQVILPPVRDLGDGFEVRRALPSAQRRMVGPFIFLDHFGPMVFRAGAAPNVRPHPHIGEIVHRDSAGNVETIRAGDVNWMTAGSGIVHSERAPPSVQASGGSLFGQQIRVALPKAYEEVEPGFAHHDGGALPYFDADGASITVVAGAAFGSRSPVPIYSELMYVDVVLEAGARLPAAAIAACALLAAGLGVWFTQAPSPFAPSEHYATAPAEVRTITLEDGSTIVLSGAGQASASITDTERRVELIAGSALFNVARDEARPFVVHTPEGDIRVLGTEFVVRIGADEVRTTVLRGSVSGAAERTGLLSGLGPAQSVTAQANGRDRAAR